MSVLAFAISLLGGFIFYEAPWNWLIAVVAGAAVAVNGILLARPSAARAWWMIPLGVVLAVPCTMALMTRPDVFIVPFLILGSVLLPILGLLGPRQTAR